MGRKRVPVQKRNMPHLRKEANVLSRPHRRGPSTIRLCFPIFSFSLPFLAKGEITILRWQALSPLPPLFPSQRCLIRRMKIIPPPAKEFNVLSPLFPPHMTKFSFFFLHEKGHHLLCLPSSLTFSQVLAPSFPLEETKSP